MDPAQSLGGPQQPPVSGKAVRLQNVHDGIAAPAVDGGTIHMIDGTYDYHHYMQASSVTCPFQTSTFAPTLYHCSCFGKTPRKSISCNLQMRFEALHIVSWLCSLSVLMLCGTKLSQLGSGCDATLDHLAESTQEI